MIGSIGLPVELWVVFASLAVAFKSGTYAIQNHFMNGGDDSTVLAHVTLVYGAMVITPIGLYVLITNPPNIDPMVYWVVAALGVVEAVGMTVYLKAMNGCGMGIASPLKKSNVVLVALIEPFLLGTVFDPAVVLGATAVGVGAYISLSNGDGLSALIRNITDLGPLLALTSAVIYAFLSLGSRYGASNLSALGYGAIIFITSSLATFVILYGVKGKLMHPRDYFSKKYLVMGSVGVGRSVFTWSAYALAPATVIVSFTKLTIVIDTFIGGSVFDEDNFRRKMIGSTIILTGIMAVVYFS